jgi:hypothetical protein
MSASYAPVEPTEIIERRHPSGRFVVVDRTGRALDESYDLEALRQVWPRAGGYGAM